MHKQLGIITRCFIAQLKYYTMEHFGVLIHTTGLVQALQILAQMDLFINILKYAFQTRFNIIPESVALIYFKLLNHLNTQYPFA